MILIYFLNLNIQPLCFYPIWQKLSFKILLSLSYFFGYHATEVCQVLYKSVLNCARGDAHDWESRRVQVWPKGPKNGRGESYETCRSFVYLYCFTKKVLTQCASLIYLQQSTRIFCSSLSLDSRKANANYEYDDNPQPYTCGFEATMDDRFLCSNVI